MPKIREFTNPIDGLQPNDRAVQATAQAARSTGAAFAEIGRDIGGGVANLGDAYTKIKTQQDISHGMATAAQVQDNLTTAWDVTLKNADPNDHSVAERFRTEQLQPILDAWQTDGFNTEEGRAWAQAHAGALQQHFFEKTAADQSLLGGQAAVQNIQQTTTSLSNTALQDPSSLNMLLGTADAGLDAVLAADPNLTPAQIANMRGELREGMRHEIAKGAFIGTARTNPDQAMQDLQDGKYKNLLDATTSNQLFGFAESIKREQRSDQRAALAMQKEQQKADFETKASAISGQMFAPDGSIVIPPNFHTNLVMLSLHPGADASAIRAMGDAAARAVENANNRTFQTTNNATWRDLAGRIGTPDSSPNSLTHALVDKAYANGNLSNTDYHFLHQAVETAKSDPASTKAMQQINQSLERLKPLVTKSNLYSGTLDQTGDLMYDDLHYDTYQRYQALVAGGKSPAEAANLITDPRDANGIQANLRPYQTNNKAGLAAIHNRTSALGGPTAAQAPALTSARKAGESAEAYLARVGK